MNLHHKNRTTNYMHKEEFNMCQHQLFGFNFILALRSMASIVVLIVSLILAFWATDTLADTDNLLENPGAEDGKSGWNWSNSTSGGSTSYITDSDTGEIVVSPHGGSRFFYVRGPKDTASCFIFQDVDVSSYAKYIDAGDVKAKLIGYAYPEDDRDSLEFKLHFRKGGSTEKEHTKSVGKDVKWHEITIDESIPSGMREIRVELKGSISGTSGILDAYFDDISLTLGPLPAPAVSTSSLNFGNLYVYDKKNSSAKDFNDSKKQTLTIKNTGNVGTTLDWDLEAPAEVEVSPDSGSIARSQSVKVTVNPSTTGSYSKTIKIKTDAGDKTITLKATVYDTPTTTYVGPAKGTNDKVNVGLEIFTTFEADSPEPLFPGAKVRGYQWQIARKQNDPDDAGWVPSAGGSAAQKKLQFDEAIEWTVYARMVDDNGVGSHHHVAIPVRAWHRPTVKDAPPESAIPAAASEIVQAGKVNWLEDKYVGVINKPTKLQADGSAEGDTVIKEYHWDFDNNWGTIELKQTANQVAQYTWKEPSISGRIRCKAVSTYGVESDDKGFNLKMYDAMRMDAGGPYTGKPAIPTALKGSINTMSYPGADVAYLWMVSGTRLDTDDNGKAEYTWDKDGIYTVIFYATVTTPEGFKVDGYEETKVTIDSKKPIALPDGPYRGGIYGGDFSPIQFEGNPFDTEQDEDVGKITIWEWTFDGTMGETKDTLWNPTRAYEEAGTYTATLKVWSEFGRESDVKNTKITVIDGKIQGVVRAADLRTPVRNVRLTLSSSHVDKDVLAKLAAADDGKMFTIDSALEAELKEKTLSEELVQAFSDEGVSLSRTARVFIPDEEEEGFDPATNTTWQILDVKTYVIQKESGSLNVYRNLLYTTGDGSIYTETDGNGFYAFEHLPLGSYRVEASKENGDPHEFENNPQAPQLTLDAPDQLAVDFVDLSVFPIGGRVVYSIQKNGEDVLVEDVRITAYPIGVNSFIEALPSTKSLDAKNQNYSFPLVAGKYFLFPEREDHEVRIIGAKPSVSSPIGKVPAGYDADSELMTIGRARTDIDFIDYTTRQITVVVEDSGEFPIDTYQGNKIKVQVNGVNGFAEGEVVEKEGQTLLEATVPPGKYTISLPNVPTAQVKGDSTKHEAEVDLTGGDGSVTMVVPVQIELTIVSDPPKLINLSVEAFKEFAEKFNLKAEDIPEGYMYYYAPELQTHTYTVEATANGNPVTDFTFFATDDISQFTVDAAAEKAYTAEATGENFEVDEVEKEKVKYTVIGGLPRASVVDESDASTYFIDPDTKKRLPIALPKGIKFRAEKDGYQPSPNYTQEVTVLGEIAVGVAQKIVAIPNINYLVLHDPPGDESFAYIDDSLTMKGLVGSMTLEIDDEEISVYPSPWSGERKIKGVVWKEVWEVDEQGNRVVVKQPKVQDLGPKGLIGYKDSDPAVGWFGLAALAEVGVGAGVVALGPLGYAIQLVKMVGLTAVLDAGPHVQYEVSPNRHLETPSGDELPDLMGPGRGDIYFGEGWMLGLQTKYLLGIQKKQDKWEPYTEARLTYDILERTNQYAYTIRDIESIVNDLDDTIKKIKGDSQDAKDEKTTLENSKKNWQNLLNKNLAYTWLHDYVLPDGYNHDQYDTDPKAAFEDFREQNDLPPDQPSLVEGQGSTFLRHEMETLIFSGGPAFEYSRTIAESDVVSYSIDVGVGTDVQFVNEMNVSAGFKMFGAGMTYDLKMGGTATISSGVGFERSYESGVESEQTVGFVLQDDDIGDNYATRVYEDPVWGTPLFFTEPGSITSDPWEPGTNKGIDMIMELVEEPANTGPFDYSGGAHYKVKVSYTGFHHLLDASGNSAGIGFTMFVHPFLNKTGLTTLFNGHEGAHQGRYRFELQKEFPVATIAVSLYPPQNDVLSSSEREYSAVLQVEAENDYQIARTIEVKTKFADRRAPRSTVTAPYDGERISPAMFPKGDTALGIADKPFLIEVFTDDEDAAKIQLQIRSKKSDGVWEPWRNLEGVVWEDPRVFHGVKNKNVTIVTHSEREPPRREFTFDWPEPEIKKLGVGEYALRAVAQDKATRLSTDGETQEPKPNVDLDAPVINFVIDGSKPTVLTTIPFYQDRESDRIYRGELSALFTDDMRATDFSDRTFVVTNLLTGETVAGFVSYSPALRKAIFVPVVPFQPNGFYHALIKTDVEKADGTIDRGVRDLAGNPLDNEFSFTFRTADTPFEETWTIKLAATDGASRDANNIAGVAFGVSDDEDEQDVRAVPQLAEQLSLSFLNRNQTEFDRDMRPADGRLSHYWFFVISNPVVNGFNPVPKVQLFWQPSVKLIQTTRQYQFIRLIEFDGQGNVTKTVPLDPTGLELNEEALAYEYAPAQGETARFFRLDVKKANFVATEFLKGSSGWKFFSAPITPQQADPFVNLGDDIDPFQLFQYDTQLSGYKIYPLDLGEVALQTGHAYFTRLASDVEVDVGGASNQKAKTLLLEAAGWHAIGNPFVKAVNVADLRVNGASFGVAASGGIIEGKLYRWKVSPSGTDSYEIVTSGGQLAPWEGYWLKTKQANVMLTLPAPSGLETFIAPLPDSFEPPIQPPALMTAPSLAHAGAEEGKRDFSLQFALRSASSADLITTLGTQKQAKIAFDTCDQSEPPTLKGTVSAYFNHSDWNTEGGKYNTDYQPTLASGEERTWNLVVYTSEPNAPMKLSWEEAIEQIPPDIMLSFRRADATAGFNSAPWQDMRQVRCVDVDTKQFITKVTFEIRAARFEMTPIDNLSVVAGEKQIEIRWAANANPFITGYTIHRQENGKKRKRQHATRDTQYALPNTQHEFIDTTVEEEATYTYQVSVHFKSGAELKSDLVTVTVLPLIKGTLLLQSYPNPFNPETWIPYELTTETAVKIYIYNVSGQLIRTLDLGKQPRGRYINKEKAAYWDGRTQLGGRVAGGVYFYVLKAGNFTKTRKMAIVK